MNDKPRMKFGVFYDFRNPRQWRRPWQERYRENLEQIDWVESSTPYHSVSLSEHHFVDDGYLPSVLLMAAVVATRTSRVDLVTNILELPLHHPLRVAEDALIADLLSDGRLRLGVAIGYRELEFAGFGTSTKHRKGRMEESMAILRGAFSGEPFSHDGRHYSFPELAVTPGPIREGGPPIWLGGTVPAALERAARLGDGFLASTDDEIVGFLEACERVGTPPEKRRTCRSGWLVVTEDPEKSLAELGPHMLYQTNQYIDYGFLKVPPYEDPQVLIDQGFYAFVDADGAIASLTESASKGCQEIHLFGMIPGEPVENSTARLQYVADKVIPAFDTT